MQKDDNTGQRESVLCKCIKLWKKPFFSNSLEELNQTNTFSAYRCQCVVWALREDKIIAEKQD